MGENLYLSNVILIILALWVITIHYEGKKKKNLQRVNLSFISACVYNCENLKNNWSDKHQEVEEAGEKIIVA